MGLSQRTQSLESQPLTLHHYFPCSNCYLPRVAYDGPRPDEEFLQVHGLQQAVTQLLPQRTIHRRKTTSEVLKGSVPC